MRRISVFSVFLIIFSLLLSGCIGVIPQLDSMLTLGADESWEFLIAMHIPELYYSASAEDMQSSFEEMLSDAETYGYDFDWSVSETNEAGNIITTTFSGKGYQTLNENVFVSQAVQIKEEDGKQNLYFNLSTYDSGLGEIYSLANQSTFLLRGAEILSTNGEQLDKNSVIWHNPSGLLTAEMKVPGSNALAIVLILIGLFLILLAVINIFKIKKSTILTQSLVSSENDPQPIFTENSSPTAQVLHEELVVGNPSAQAPQRKFCVYCGSQLLEDAKFCVNCGKEYS